MREEAANELKQEEGRIDGDHDLDPRALGPRHFGCRQCDRRRNIARLSLMTMSTLTRDNQRDDPKRNNGRDGRYQLAKNKRVMLKWRQREVKERAKQKKAASTCNGGFGVGSFGVGDCSNHK